MAERSERAYRSSRRGPVRHDQRRLGHRRAAARAMSSAAVSRVPTYVLVLLLFARGVAAQPANRSDAKQLFSDAQAAADEGRLPDAESILNRALAIAPQDHDGQLQLAVVYLFTDRFAP